MKHPLIPVGFRLATPAERRCLPDGALALSGGRWTPILFSAGACRSGSSDVYIVPILIPTPPILIPTPPMTNPSPIPAPAWFPASQVPKSWPVIQHCNGHPRVVSSEHFIVHPFGWRYPLPGELDPPPEVKESKYEETIRENREWAQAVSPEPEVKEPADITQRRQELEAALGLPPVRETDQQINEEVDAEMAGELCTRRRQAKPAPTPCPVCGHGHEKMPGQCPNQMQSGNPPSDFGPGSKYPHLDLAQFTAQFGELFGRKDITRWFWGLLYGEEDAKRQRPQVPVKIMSDTEAHHDAWVKHEIDGTYSNTFAAGWRAALRHARHQPGGTTP